MRSQRDFLEDLFRTAIAAAHPARCLPPLLPEAPPSGRLILLAAGKAAGSMAEVAEAHYLDRGFPKDRLSGIAVARHGYGRPLRVVDMVEAGHPVPDQAGLDAAARTLALADSATARRSRAGADVGRRLGQLDCARAGPVARIESRR